MFPLTLKLNLVPRLLLALCLASVCTSFTTMPTSAESGNAKKGEEVFTKNNCSICHPGGSNTLDPAHPIKGAEFARKYQDDRVLEDTIRKGFKESGMPANDKTKINDAEMKDLIAFIRTMSATKVSGKADSTKGAGGASRSGAAVKPSH